jgi:hypothetical protein
MPSASPHTVSTSCESQHSPAPFQDRADPAFTTFSRTGFMVRSSAVLKSPIHCHQASEPSQTSRSFKDSRLIHLPIPIPPGVVITGVSSAAPVRRSIVRAFLSAVIVECIPKLTISLRSCVSKGSVVASFSLTSKPRVSHCSFDRVS